MTEVNGLLFFTATDSNHGSEVWRSDGTVAGTFLLKDVYPGTSSSVQYLTNFNGMLYFAADNSVNGRVAAQLWHAGRHHHGQGH